MRSASTTLRPASIIVANWREKIWSDFVFTLFIALLLSSLSAPSRHRAGVSSRYLLKNLGQQAADAKLLASSFDGRRLHLAGQLEALGVDRRVGVRGHVG